MEQEVSKHTPEESKNKPKKSLIFEPVNHKRTAKANTQREAITKQRLPSHLQDKARHEHLCLGCLDPNHQKGIALIMHQIPNLYLEIITSNPMPQEEMAHPLLGLMKRLMGH